ncbi:hypothetical protein [Lactobacillus brevis] [Lactiplantibacillus mudanjiangensis]|uniref:hypothetical protein n=1 Tax=Lactiplantibacillus mudanjiangensis TaxID=1296538 RepID=UPI001014396D|nr:hypothetical protein [Lactobacillus brevis] [Lactiplantibacillus mudanjiangensis]
MSERPDITRKLSELVEKRLRNSRMYWSPEVNFDKNQAGNRRVDFVGFKPFTPDYVDEPASVELGTFAFFEIKSSIADFESGHGLTFYGDENYLVCTEELAEQLHQDMKLPNDVNAILCPNSKWTGLRTKFKCRGTHRKRAAAEILWEIVRSHGDRNFSREAQL